MTFTTTFTFIDRCNTV